MVTKGKAKRTYRKSGGRSVMGRRSDAKKAYVTLKEGDSIPVFEAVKEAEETQAKNAEQIQKAVDKKAAKESKKAEKK
jgi:hypothetical protein